MLQKRLSHWTEVFSRRGVADGLSILRNAVMVKAYLRSEGRLRLGAMLPTNLGVGITSVCNLRCPACMHGNKAQGAGFVKPRPPFMRLEQFKAIADQSLLYAYDLNLTGAGESFLNPDIYGIIACAKAKGAVVYLDTNGHNVDADNVLDSGLDMITYALDGFSQASYEKYRIGGDFDRVLGSIEELSAKAASRGSGITVRAKFLVNAHNEHEIEAAKRHFGGMPNVQLFFDYFWIPPEQGQYVLADDYTATKSMYETWAPKSTPQFSIYRLDEARGLYRHISADLPFKKMCQQAYIGMYINVNGDAFPCCKAALPETPELFLGNVFEEGLAAVFNGQRATVFRDRFTRAGGRFSLCAECWVNKAESQEAIRSQSTASAGGEAC